MIRWTVVLMLLLLAGCATGQHAVTVYITPQPGRSPQVRLHYRLSTDDSKDVFEVAPGS